MNPVNILMGPKIGDLMHSLTVPAYYYHTLGRKTNFYLSTLGIVQTIGGQSGGAGGANSGSYAAAGGGGGGGGYYGGGGGAGGTTSNGAGGGGGGGSTAGPGSTPGNGANGVNLNLDALEQRLKKQK